MWQFNRLRNRGSYGTYQDMLRSTMDPHSPWNEKGARAQELRKVLFPTFKRVPGRKIKFFAMFCFFCSLMGNSKFKEIKDIYK